MKKLIFLLGLLLLSAVVPAMAGNGQSGELESLWLLAPLVLGITLDPASIAGLYKSFNTIFNEAMAAAQPQYQRIAMEVPSSTAINVYPWLGAWPKMREWLGDRQVHKLEAFDWQIVNKTWEGTIEIPVESVEDDQYGIWRPVVAGQGTLVRLHPDDLVFGLLNDGFTLKGYDGKTFFATDHKSGSNKATAALSFAAGGSYAVAKATLDRVKDSQGNPLFSGAERDILVVGPELDEKARIGLNSDYISVSGGSTQDNPWKNSADLVKSPKITSATAWFLLRPFAGLLPVIFQMRRQPRFIGPGEPGIEHYRIMKNKLIYGVDGRWNAGYGLHQLAYGSTGAV